MVEMAAVATADRFRLGYAGDTLNAVWYLRRLLGSADQIEYFTSVGTFVISGRMLSFVMKVSLFI